MQIVFSAIWEFIVCVFYTNAAITIPIIVSIVAVWISIATAKKQNKIALFELRYKCYSQLKTIYSFDAATHDCDNPRIIIKIFDALWGTNIAKINGDEKLVHERCKIESISHDIHQIKFLFNHKFNTNFSDILKNTQEIVGSATAGEVNADAQKELHRLCELFEEKDLSYMRKELKI